MFRERCRDGPVRQVLAVCALECTTEAFEAFLLRHCLNRIAHFAGPFRLFIWAQAEDLP